MYRIIYIGHMKITLVACQQNVKITCIITLFLMIFSTKLKKGKKIEVHIGDCVNIYVFRRRGENVCSYGNNKRLLVYKLTL
uniref:Uncharacterized protein n=1 Tax=Arundo donax TaxID=35708 RepID=A0A0A9DVE3_ARUDO